MTRPLGIAFISALATPPVDFIHLAADLGCTQISLGLAPMTANPFGFPAWSLRKDAGLRATVRAALAERQVALAVGEVFLARPGADIADGEGDLALFAELGAERVTMLSLEPDAVRGSAQIAKFVTMAEAAEIRPTLEFMPGMPVGTLQAAQAEAARFAEGQLPIVLDCMHFIRSGGRPEELASVSRAEIAEIQLCDVPIPAGMKDYGAEALHHRLLPGDGDLPLADILAHLPADVPVSLEVPMLQPAEAGVPLRDTLARAVARAQALIGAR